MALLSMRDVSVGFGGALVLENISLQIDRGERLGLVGRNGVGKSTLLKIIAGELEPDAGLVIRERGVRVAYLVQEVPEGLMGSVAEILAEGLAASESSPSPTGDEDAWRRRLQMDTIIAAYGARPHGRFRAPLGRAQAAHPPGARPGARPRYRAPGRANQPPRHRRHRLAGGLSAALWRYAGFRDARPRLPPQAGHADFEIDRGRLIDWVCDFDTFTTRKQAILAVETTQAAEFDKKLAQEEV